MTQEARIAGASAGRRALAAVVIAGTLGLTGCSSVPDALNPVEWYHGASDTVGGWFGDEQQPPAEPGRTQAADAGSSPNSAYPNLSTVPQRPTPTTTAEEREALRKGLVADRANARYTGSPQAPATAPAPAPSSGPSASQSPAPTQQATVPPPAPEQPAPRQTARPEPARPEPASSGERSALWPNRPAPETPGLKASTTGRVGGTSHRTSPSVAAPEPSSMPERRAPAPTEQVAERTTYDSAGPSTAPQPAPS